MRSAVFTLAAAIVVSTVAFIWTNRFLYSTTAALDGRQQTRTNRLTGQTEVLWVGIGWRDAETPMGIIEAAIEESDKTPQERAVEAWGEGLSQR
jgi:hypothetical protein